VAHAVLATALPTSPPVSGDFVDRGAYGVEVMAVLMCLRLLYPSLVLLNRGNHEDRSQNAYYNRHQHGCAPVLLMPPCGFGCPKV
jgi:hypothetical protein